MIVVAGYYGFGNAGDEAIAAAIAGELRARGERVTLLSADPPGTARLGVNSVPRMAALPVLRALAASKALWLGGGGLLQDRTSARSLLYYLFLLRAARTLRRRVVIFNQSIGPLSPGGRRQVARSLRGVPAIVRDEGSAALLRELGLSPRIGGDPALLLPAPGAVRDPRQVLLAPRGDQAGATATLRELAARLRGEGYTVRAAALYPAEDREAALALDPDALVSSDPHAVLELVARSGFVIGVRLHAPILAAAAGVPFAGVAYDPKVSGFCADAGAPHFGLEASAAQLRAALEREPDWGAVSAMKTRARASFDWALEGQALDG